MRRLCVARSTISGNAKAFSSGTGNEFGSYAFRFINIRLGFANIILLSIMCNSSILSNRCNFPLSSFLKILLFFFCLAPDTIQSKQLSTTPIRIDLPYSINPRSINDTLIYLSPENNRKRYLIKDVNSYYPEKNVSFYASSAVISPMSNNGKNYRIPQELESDGYSIYTYLPQHYFIPFKDKCGPYLGISDNYAKSVTLQPAISYICAEIENSARYDSLVILSQDASIWGKMIFDGAVLYPMEADKKQISVSLKKSVGTIFIPIPSNSELNLSICVFKGGKPYQFKKEIELENGSKKEKYITDKYASKEIKGRILQPNEVIKVVFKNSLVKKKNPEDPENPENPENPEDNDRQKWIPDDDCMCNTRFGKNVKYISPSELLKILDTELQIEKMARKDIKEQWRMFMNNLPDLKTRKFKRRDNGLYSLDFRLGINMEIAAGLAANMLKDFGLKTLDYRLANNPEEDSTHYFKNRPYGDVLEQRRVLKIENCKWLENLNVINAELTDLVIRNCPNLKSLTFIGSSIGTVDIECCPDLEIFGCIIGRLTDLNICGCPNLKHLDVSGNLLKELDVSKFPLLESLNCTMNDLSELDVSKNKRLEDLQCACNLIKVLDLSKNRRLKKLTTVSNYNIKILPSEDFLESLRSLTRWNIHGKYNRK